MVKFGIKKAECWLSQGKKKKEEKRNQFVVSLIINIDINVCLFLGVKISPRFRLNKIHQQSLWINVV